jgi:hypothetical protein
VINDSSFGEVSDKTEWAGRYVLVLVVNDDVSVKQMSYVREGFSDDP